MPAAPPRPSLAIPGHEDIHGDAGLAKGLEFFPCLPVVKLGEAFVA